MKRCGLGILCVLFLAVFAQATLILHIQSPWRDDATKAGYFPHVLGSAGGGYNPSYGEGSQTKAVADGDGWFTYTWDKTLADFQDWMSFTVSLYPDSSDQNYNNNNGIKWAELGEVKVSTLFGSDTEIWLYTNTADMSYTKSFIAPGSKIVWFKSPWGNKALPQMVFGADTVLMRFMIDDASSCGWFYGALTPEMISRNVLGTAYFTRYKTPYMSFPAEGTVDLSQAFSLQDSIYIDGTAAVPEIELSMSSIGECFDSTRTLHIFHPWRSNTSFRDSVVYISIGNNILNNPTATEYDNYKYWLKYDFDPSVVSSSAWGSTGALFNIYRGQNDWPQVTYFADSLRPLASSLFPMGIYEAWIYTRGNGVYDLLFSPLEPKVVRLLSPWDNMTPSLIVADDTVKMGPISTDTCGWYQGVYYKHTDDWNVVFKQTFGMEYYGGKGTVAEGEIVDSLIDLNEWMTAFDTVWVYPYPVSNSSPVIDMSYPGRLGICPAMKISALVLDWAGEANPDSVDVDFGGIYGGNAYTTVEFGGTEYKTCTGRVLGMVQDTLVNGVPARVDSLIYPWDKCSAAHEIEKWFVPQVVAKDASGLEYTNAVCRDIDLTLDEEGFWLADISANNEAGGFFPIDDFRYLDSAKTILNPKFDWSEQLRTENGVQHNYSFAMKVSAQFKYIKGQYFEFRGDDDVWVFINNRLVVDIGGCHNPEEGAVNLDTMGLEEGVEYPFHIFFSERNATGSNFKMRTSINLQTQRTYLPIEVPHLDGQIEYNILQLLIDESISCDVSSTTKIDTSYAQSVFTLFDGNGILPKEGKILEPGLNYGGINISENMAGFTIDTTAIVRSRSLPSGNYILQFALATDPSQYSQVIFTVPEYPLSEIAFVDSDDEVIRNVDGSILDTLTDMTLGEFAFVSYPVRITLLYLDSIRDSNVVTLDLSSPDSLVFFDKNNVQITSIETDGTGFADFFVMGTADVVNGSFTVGGAAVGNQLTWKNINLQKPPVPYANSGMMFDRNGDGVPDSLCVPFSEKFSEDIPDTVSWIFGDSTLVHRVSSVESVYSLVEQDSIVVIVADSLLPKVFTGKENEAYSGTFSYHYTHLDTETGDLVPLSMKASIQDKVGPILEKGIIIPQSDSYSKLTLTLSEGIKFDDADARSMFEFKVWRMGMESSSQMVISSISQKKNKSQVEILFYAPEGGVMPTVGDSVRLVPGGVFDLSENPAHANNAWVRITGEPRAEIEVPGLVTLFPDSLGDWTEKDGVVPMAAAMGESITDIIEREGLPGHLIRYELGELAVSDEMLPTVRIKWEVGYFTNLGQYVNSGSGVIACNDSTVFNLNPSEPKNCRDNPGNIFLKWNARSETGRVVGTGAYISKLSYKIISDSQTMVNKDETYTLGIKRAKK